MQSALILYGSRARGEAQEGSDVDLILADCGSGLGRPHISNGVSVHWYSQDWLKAEAMAGNLFVYHVAFEGVQLVGSIDLLDSLRSQFKLKSCYKDEARDAAMVLALAMLQDFGNSPFARKRFFWALRTLLITETANRGSPVFSASALQEASGIEGVADLIKKRETAPQEQCIAVGSLALLRNSAERFDWQDERQLRDLMIGHGGMAGDFVRRLEEPEAVASCASEPYC